LGRQEEMESRFGQRKKNILKPIYIHLYFGNVCFFISGRVRGLVDTSFLSNKTHEGSNI
jgi:hypothetical protein